MSLSPTRPPCSAGSSGQEGPWRHRLDSEDPGAARSLHGLMGFPWTSHLTALSHLLGWGRGGGQMKCFEKSKSPL